MLPLPFPGQPAQEVFGQVHPQDFRYGTWGWLTIVLLGLTIAAVVRRRSGTRPYLPYFAIGVVGLLSAQGPTFRWAKTDLIDNPVFLIPYYVVPGYDALRVPARWFPVIGLLGLVLFSLRGAEPVMAVMARKRKAVLATAILFAAAFVIFEQSPAPLALGESYRLDERPVYKWLAAQPEGSVIVELPISVDIASRTTQEVEGRRMYLSTFHWMRRVNGGISPVIDPRYGPAAFALDNLGVSPEGSALLDRYGVDYVLVVDEDFIAYGRRDADIVRARLDSLPGLKRLRDFPGATVYATR
jgi:hypothetical protein